ncbi:MAG: hypothetical protein M1821_008034 [Bathelium mastoideum]|nr:MAG: hypothetical protein M1821_008034 [Bathelium mastoideum]
MLKGHTGPVWSVAFSYNWALLASGLADGTIRIWDVSISAGKQTLEEHNDDVTSIIFSHDLTLFASASHDCTVRIWNLSSGVCLQTLKGHNDWITTAVFSYDSKLLASASGDYTIRIWNPSSGVCLQTLKEYFWWITTIAFSCDSKLLVSASRDGTMRIWNLNSGVCLQTLTGCESTIFAVAFSSDSSLLASASEDGVVRIWDVSSGACPRILEEDKASDLSCDSTLFVAASYDGCTLQIKDSRSGGRVAMLKAPKGFEISLAFLHDSTLLASTSGSAWQDNTVLVWDTRNGECQQILHISKGLSSISANTIGSLPSIPSIKQDENESQGPQYHGVTLSSSREWIKHESKELVWLPPEYRPGEWAVSGNIVAIGTRSGKVWTCNLQIAGFGRG